MGSAHGLDLVFRAAQLLQQQAPDVVFLLVGEGSERARLEAMAGSGLSAKVRLVQAQPLQAIPGVLAASDVCLALLKADPLFRTVVPTKMLEYMAAARPVVCNVAGEAASLLERAGGGIAVPPGNAEALASAVLKLRADPALRARLGASGRRYVEQNADWESRSAAYEDILSRVVARRTRGSRGQI